jgi:hypothetical protein
MAFSIYAASAPVFVNSLRNMSNWLDKAAAEKPELELIQARLAPDMHALPFQFQSASDAAKFGVARLVGIEAPVMEDTEASFAELQERCARTIQFIESIDEERYSDAAKREVQLRFPNGFGYRFDGASYLTRFALPNFFFHVTTAYAILRAAGVALGKPDFLQHLGAPNLTPADK